MEARMVGASVKKTPDGCFQRSSQLAGVDIPPSLHADKNICKGRINIYIEYI